MGFEALKAASCDKAWWIMVNAIMAMMHIAGSIYIVYRILQDDSDAEQYKDQDDHEQQGYQAHTGTAPQTTVAVNPTENEYRKMDDDQKKAGDVPSKPIFDENPLLNYFFNGNRNPQDKHRESTSQHVKSVAPKQVGAYDVGPDYDGPSSSVQRMRQVLCYDPGTAMYFVVVVAWVIWQSFGVTVAISLAGSNNDQNMDEGCDKNQALGCNVDDLWISIHDGSVLRLRLLFTLLALAERNRESSLLTFKPY